MTDDDSEPDRPIKVHASGDAGALAYVSEEELKRLENGEPFWKVVEEVPEFTPGGDWSWSVASDPGRDESPSEEDEPGSGDGGAE
jgi:hypothetical protein